MENSLEKVYILDYGAGNVRSVINAISFLGFTVEFVKSPADLAHVHVCFTLSYSIGVIPGRNWFSLVLEISVLP